MLSAPRTEPYVRLSRIRLPPRVQTTHRERGGVCGPALVTRQRGAVSGTCFAELHSPWPRPLAPPTPRRIAPPRSPASQLLWPRPTSHLRASPATAPHLPGTDRRHRCQRPDVGSPSFRRAPFARDLLFDPSGAPVPRDNGTAHVAFGSKDSLRPRDKGISGLNHTPHATAVYASRPPLLSARATLASRRLATPYLGWTFTSGSRQLTGAVLCPPYAGCTAFGEQGWSRMPITSAATAADYAAFATLVRDYVDWCRARYAQEAWLVDRVFSEQALARELEDLAASYAPPHGRVLLAREAGEICGGGAYRRLSAEACEMKRLFVPERFRGKGFGRALCNSLLASE